MPDLAERLDNPDPLTYIAHLRRGVTFHDGQRADGAGRRLHLRHVPRPDFISPYKGAYRMLASVTRARRLHRRVHAEGAVRRLPDAAGHAAHRARRRAADSLRTHPDRHRPVPLRPLRRRRSAWSWRRSTTTGTGAPNNAGIVMKIVPDDTMRGLELRKGTVDLIINDLPPDIVHQLERSGDFRVSRSPASTSPTSASTCATRCCRTSACAMPSATPSTATRSSRYLRRGLARPAFGLIPSQAWAFEPDVLQFTHDPARADATARRGRLSRSGRRRPAAAAAR